MPPVIVDTPHGTYKFPSQEQADAYLLSIGGNGTKPAPRGIPPSSTGEDYALAAKRGVTRGLMAPADMATSLGDTPVPLGGVPFIVKQLMGRDFNPSERVLSAVGLDKKPGGTGAKYLEEGTAGAVGGAVTGGRQVLPAVISGAAGGVAGEGAAEMFGDNPLTRVIGALLGGMTGYMGHAAVTGSRAKTRVNAVAKDIPDKTFDDISAAVKSAQEEGVKVGAHQALPERTPLASLAADVGSTTTKGPKQAMDLEAQGSQAKGAADKLLGMMGGIKDPTEAAHGAQKAATKAIEKADTDLSNTVKPWYETDLNKMTDFDKRKAGLMRSIFGGSDEATEHGAHLKALAKSIGKAKSPEELNAIYNEWNQGLQQNKLNGKSVVDFTAGQVRERGLSKLDRFLDSVQVDRKRAQDEFQYQTSRVTDPLRRSPTGQIAGRAGLQEDVPTATARILKVLDGGDVRAQTILDTQKTLDAQAPGTFAKLAAAAFEKKVEAAFKGREGQTPFEAPAELAQAVWGGPKQTAARENFRATMAGVARSNGLSGAAEGEFVKGAEKIMQAIEAAGREKSIPKTPHDKSAIVETAKGAFGSMIYPPQAPGAVGRAIERVTGHQLEKRLYDLLWSGPEGVEKIRKYARMSIPEIRRAGAAATGTAAFEESQVKEN